MISLTLKTFLKNIDCLDLKFLVSKNIEFYKKLKIFLIEKI